MIFTLKQILIIINSGGILMKNSKKVALITGGGKGIGFGIAKAMAKAGFDLVITGRTLPTLENAKIELEKLGAKVLLQTADGGDEEAVALVIKNTIGTYGRLDTLINNAQASKSGYKLVEHTKKDFDLAVNSGLYATFFYMREAFPYLKEKKGSVVNFASGAGLFGKDGQASYAASKEAIRGLSRVAATEWGEFDINVNVICPLVYTEQLDSWRKAYPDLYDKTIQNIPMRKFADAEKDIGGLCVFLTSESGHYITGESMTVQGGSGLRP